MGGMGVTTKLILFLSKLLAILHNSLTGTVKLGAKAVDLFCFAPSTVAPVLLLAGEIVLSMGELCVFC
jgi:hypothetical protein